MNHAKGARSMANERRGDMTQGNPVRLMIAFAIPMMVGGIFQLMYNMVDTVVLGRYVGVNALAAIGAARTAPVYALADESVRDFALEPAPRDLPAGAIRLEPYREDER